MSRDDFEDQLDGGQAIFRMIRHGEIALLDAWLKDSPVLFRKAVTHSRGHMNRTPLHAAVMFDHIPVVKLLLKVGADIESFRDRNDTPLFWASSEEMVDCLLQHGANPLTTDTYGSTPLHWAARSSTSAVLKRLIEHGSDVNAQNKQGQTPLHYATGTIWHFNIVELTKVESYECVRILIEHGANVNQQDKRHYVALHGVSVPPDMTKRLLDGQLKYEVALPQAMLNIVKLLLKNGADPTIRNDEGYTPLDLSTGEVRQLFELFSK